MRLTAKIAIVLVLGLGVVLGLFARDQIDEATWRLEGKHAAMYLIQYTNETLRSAHVETKMRVRWVWLDPEVDDPNRPRIPFEQIAPALREGELSLRSPDGSRMYTYVPVDVEIDGEPRGALEISESTAPIAETARTIRSELITTTLILVAACLVMIVLVGTWFVGRPLRLLANAADRICGGDLSVRVDLRQSDEVGKLAETMNQTVEKLSIARDRVVAETESRVKAVEQLRHADRLSSVGTFAAGIAHELGTPLAVVSGRARLIADGTVSGDEVARHAESIGRQADKMAAIIRQLLDFARRRSVTLSGKNLVPLATETLSLLRPMATKRGVELELIEPDEPIQVSVDGVQFQQVITNLAMNAIDAMTDGGVVTVEIGREHAEPPADHGGEAGVYAFCKVRDQGPGIREDQLAVIFEPFYTTKPVGEGTGLGLAVSHGIAFEHGGWIEVESVIGKGSTFSVYLPLGDGQANIDRR
jgi:signal transduction histidine kinase